MLLDRRQAILALAFPALVRAQNEEPFELRAGPLTMLFEPETAFLRYIRYGDREVLRGIYAAVRDRNWGTVQPRISNLVVERAAGGFALSFDVACRQDAIDFAWKGRILGRGDGSLRFEFDGTARSTFLRNRIGFCVLHPVAECAGAKVRVENTQKVIENARFPLKIAPNQPFLNMLSIAHPVVDGLEAEVRFEGEVFEMEDQRNWTDGSFKTYCTPLAKPFPVEVRSGTNIKQAIDLRLIGKAAAPAVIRRNAIALKIAGKPSPLPEIGLGLSPKPLTSQEIARLKGFAHLRADSAQYERAAKEAAAIGAGLELAIHVDNLNDFSGLQGMKAARYLIFHRRQKSTRAEVLEAARKALGPKAKLAAGTDAYFTELNRERPPLEHADFVTYSINPQVHAFDRLSLIETLEIQAATLDSARVFCGPKPLLVSPVTLRPRFNPNATGDVKPIEPDPRQPTLFAAAWTLGSLKYLAEGGAAAVTFYEASGPRGIQDGDRVFPAYHVLADVNEFRGGNVVPLVSSSKLEVEGMLLERGPRRRLMIANLSPEPKVVRVEAPGFASATLRMLDSAGPQPPRRFESGDAIQLGLLPFAIARIDNGYTDAQR